MQPGMLTLTTLKYLCINYGDQRVFFNLKSSYINVLVSSDSFQHPCYGSAAIINILILSVRERLRTSDFDV